MLLAQATQGGAGPITQVALGIGVIIAVCVVAYIVMTKVKGVMLSNSTPEDAPLELNDFREMHKRGELTDEEYENLRATFLVGVPKTNELRSEIERRRTAQSGGAGRSDPKQGL